MRPLLPLHFARLLLVGGGGGGGGGGGAVRTPMRMIVYICILYIDCHQSILVQFQKINPLIACIKCVHVIVHCH